MFIPGAKSLKNNYRPTLTPSAQTSSHWPCAPSALCLHFNPCALSVTSTRDPGPSIKRTSVTSTPHWRASCTCGHNCRSRQLVTLANSSFCESGSFDRALDTGESQISALQFVANPESKFGKWAWAYYVTECTDQWCESVKSHFYTIIVHKLHTTRKYTCIS